MASDEESPDSGGDLTPVKRRDRFRLPVFPWRNGNALGWWGLIVGVLGILITIYLGVQSIGSTYNVSTTNEVTRVDQPTIVRLPEPERPSGGEDDSGSRKSGDEHSGSLRTVSAPPTNQGRMEPPGAPPVVRPTTDIAVLYQDSDAVYGQAIVAELRNRGVRVVDPSRAIGAVGKPETRGVFEGDEAAVKALGADLRTDKVLVMSVTFSSVRSDFGLTSQRCEAGLVLYDATEGTQLEAWKQERTFPGTNADLAREGAWKAVLTKLVDRTLLAKT